MLVMVGVFVADEITKVGWAECSGIIDENTPDRNQPFIQAKAMIARNIKLKNITPLLENPLLVDLRLALLCGGTSTGCAG